MHLRMGRLIVALSVIVGITDRSEAGWRRRPCRCYSPCPTVVTVAPPSAIKLPRVRTYLEGAIADDDDEDVVSRAKGAVRTDALLPLDVRIPADEIFEGTDRKTPKTTVVHGGETEAFNDVDELISFFESPLRKQEKWWRKAIKQTTEERNDEVELVNVTVKDAWIYEMSHQKDNDYHLLIGIRPDRDEGRYVNAEISGINPDSPDAKDLWQVRKSFKKQYVDSFGKPLTTGFTQPRNPIHIRLSGSVFLDADHGRAAVGHHDIKNFTSWEIHPITSIQILGD